MRSFGGIGSIGVGCRCRAALLCENPEVPNEDVGGIGHSGFPMFR